MKTAMVMVVGQPAELSVLDLDARLERACELIMDAGQAGAQSIIFPEAYLPGAPPWLWLGLDSDTLARELQAIAQAHAVVVPGPASDRLCRVAQRSRVAVAIGLVERDNHTYYNSVLIIDAQGRICGHYRAALGPTNARQGWNLVAPADDMQIKKAQHSWTGGI